MWSPFKVYVRAAKAEGELEAHKALLADARAQIVKLEQEKREILDWLLSLNGAPTLYGHDAPLRDHEKENKNVRQNPFAGASRGANFRHIAEGLEAEALAAVGGRR